MIMRFRPANISLINRRLYLPRLLLTLSSIEKDDHRILTGHYISMSVLPTIRTFPAHRATLISMRALMNFKEREGWSFHIV
jgi:hypothetical protein